VKVTLVEPGTVMDQLEGATVATWFVEDEEGLHICFADGRTLIIAGTFAISILKAGSERLH